MKARAAKTLDGPVTRLTVTVRLFAGAAEATRVRELSFSLDGGTTVAGLHGKLVRDFPALAPMKASLRFAVNREFAGPERVLRDGDEVAVIPPVSGG